MEDPAIIERLQKLHDKAGVLTPDAVLADAKSAKSPLHKCFEWDDSKAAYEYRKEQARTLIRSVRLVVKEENHTYKTIAYVRDPDTPKNAQGYASVKDLVSSKSRSRKALENELLRAEAAMNRAYEVAYSLGLGDEVTAILAQIRHIKSVA